MVLKEPAKLLIVSVLLIIGGLSVLLSRYLIFKNFLVLQPDSTIFRFWEQFPVLVPLEIYFFNWTNPEEIHNSSIKPKFKEIGPFHFWQEEKKKNIIWNNNGSITYNQQKFWYYDQKSSKVDINVNITTIDPVGAAISYATRHHSPILRKMLSYSLLNLGRDVHFTHSAEQLLFDGYEDILIAMGSRLPFYATFWFNNWNKAGWIYNRNGSNDYEGIYTMGTGLNSNLGNMYSWNYSNHTSFYKGHCGEVKGSAGQLYSSNLSKDKILIFSTDLGRYVTLIYEKEEIVKEILGYKYTLDDYTLDNGTTFPENKCFCNGECMPSGVLNISATRLDVPLFISLPHFNRADPSYVNSVEGMKPDKKKHEAYIVIEPRTGIPLQVNAKIQANVMVESQPDFMLYDNISRKFIPVIWAEQKLTIPDNFISYLKMFFLITTICTYTGVIMILIGSIQMSFIIYKKCKPLTLEQKKKCLYTKQNKNCNDMDHRENLVHHHKYLQ